MKAISYTPIGIVILAIITLFTSPLLYADNQSTTLANNQSDPWPHISLSFTIHERYLANRISRQLNDEPSLWTQVSFKWDSGWYANWLEIHGLNDSTWSNNSADETQVTIDKSWKAWDLDIKAEATLINIYPISAWFEHDRLSVDVYVSKLISLSAEHTITPELRLIWFGDTSDIESGVAWSRVLGRYLRKSTMQQFTSRASKIVTPHLRSLYRINNSTPAFYLHLQVSAIFRPF